MAIRDDAGTDDSREGVPGTAIGLREEGDCIMESWIAN
jgi:hypothetical protein